NEEVLKEIARQTGGTYFPVRTQDTVPGTLLTALLEAASALPRETPPAEDFSNQYRWFLSAGLLFLLASFLVGDRWARPAQSPEEKPDMKQLSAKSGPTPWPWSVAAGVVLA